MSCLKPIHEIIPFSILLVSLNLFNDSFNPSIYFSRNNQLRSFGTLTIGFVILVFGLAELKSTVIGFDLSNNIYFTELVENNNQEGIKGVLRLMGLRKFISEAKEGEFDIEDFTQEFFTKIITM